MLNDDRRRSSRSHNLTGDDHPPPPLDPIAPFRIASLPDELIHEVFRDECLSSSDLARLSLVSRRFREPTTETLYEKVHIDFVSENGEDYYSNHTWKVLSVLKESEKYRRYVKVLEFDRPPRTPSSEHNLESSLVPATFAQALKTFLRLAPKTVSLAIGDGLASESVPGGILTNHGPNVRKIRATRIGFETLVEVADRLERVQTKVIAFPPLPNARVPTAFPRLRHLEIGDILLRPDIFDLFDRDHLNLQVLKINAYVASSLDFSRLSNLKTLHLHEVSTSVTTLARSRLTMSQVGTSVRQLFKSLQSSPSLCNIGLSSGRYQDPWGAFILNEWGLLNTIPTLSTYVFESDLPLDRIARILHSNPGPTVKRIIRSAPGVPPRIKPFEATKVRAVVAMLEGTGIELFHAQERDRLY